MTDILVVVLWQVVLVGAWGLSRRIRRLERLTIRPPCLAQVVALRENIAGLRADLAEIEDEQAHWTRSITRAVERTEDDVEALMDRFQQLTRLLLEQMAQLERRLADDDGIQATGLRVPNRAGPKARTHTVADTGRSPTTTTPRRVVQPQV
jgi:hypothetical protein